MEGFLKIAQFTVRFFVKFSVDIMFDKLELTINSKVDARFITMGKICVMLLVEFFVDTVFKAFHRQVQEGAEVGLEGLAGGDGGIAGAAGEVDEIVAKAVHNCNNSTTTIVPYLLNKSINFWKSCIYLQMSYNIIMTMASCQCNS